ncbi:MAG: secondary thiamine-phosphate synthase enzyme YjbQ [Actinomycetota bacterium]|nr:secondary thiamine-phosphate synthase enzyme YjbQ [Actinomycetota bacterium]
MKLFSNTLGFRTGAHIELVNITPDVSRLVAKSGVREGIALVYSPHTTTALIINENEPRLLNDLREAIKDLIPWDKAYEHNLIDDNAPSHIVGAFLGNSLALPITRGKIELGTWQSIFLVELDGSRSREIKVKIVGE